MAPKCHRAESNEKQFAENRLPSQEQLPDERISSMEGHGQRASGDKVQVSTHHATNQEQMSCDLYREMGKPLSQAGS